MNIINQYRGLPRQIYYISITRLIVEMGIMFVFPMMTLLLTQRLGFTTIQTGLIMTVLSIGGISGSLLGGRFADRFGRRRSYLCLIMIAIIMMILTGLICTDRRMIILLLIGFAATNALFPITSALVVDYSDESNRNECLSLGYIFSNIGTAIGPAIAGLLFYRHMPSIFFCMAALYCISFLLILRMGKESYVPGSAGTEEIRGEDSLFKALLHVPILIAFTLIFTGICFCYGQLSYVLPLQLNDSVGLERSSHLVSFLWTFNGIVCLTCTPFLVLLSKRFRPLINVAAGLVFYAVGFGMLVHVLPLPLYTLSILIWSSGEILINTNSGVFIADKAPATHRARCMSLLDLAWGAARCVSMLIFSYLMELFSYSFCWILIAGLCLLLAAITLLLHIRDKRNSAS